MFRKFLIFAMFATAAGYCFADDKLPQIVTSEVFYSDAQDYSDDNYQEEMYQESTQYQMDQSVMRQSDVPVWPLVGSDADIDVGCTDGYCVGGNQSDSIKVVSKVGADLVVENNFNLGGSKGFGGWSGGANMLHGTQIPVGFDDDCNSGAEMPLLHREVLEDDGANVLAVSRSGRKRCNTYADGYLAFATKNGMRVSDNGQLVNGEGQLVDENGDLLDKFSEIAVDVTADAEPDKQLTDVVRSWVVANGQTLREVLQDWCTKEGWDLVWTTSREYPIEASAVFKGRFTDVASALVRNFSRANPVPYAKFYKGNRVLVISTNEE